MNTTNTTDQFLLISLAIYYFGSLSETVIVSDLVLNFREIQHDNIEAKYTSGCEICCKENLN
ncbi:hypothetical protein TrispH2_008753 [Trichoplax sp. H2]|nr:hypothetical protein TrispH2_008753 [Trichoplax sp. H2]|eukprot:RDD40093.1 hypothetical protein TrispH2_008753 [Trichoplax sp. H2]